MKKIINLMLMLVLLLLVNGCVAKQIDEKNENFSFLYKSNEIKLDENMQNILKINDDYIDYIESESCAFKGLDKKYIYEHFEIYTYPKDGEDFVLQIYLLDNMVKTQEGLTINDGYEKMIETYGNVYELNGNEYIYKRGNTALSFIVENDFIVQIAYSLEIN